MYKFGKHSQHKINTLCDDLQILLQESIKDAPHDFSIICGHRGEKEQNAAYNAGNSQLKFPQSNHNSYPSKAFDFAPYYKDNPHIRWDDVNAFVMVAEHILDKADELGISVEWGGNWENFKDYPHIEVD